MFFGAVPAWMMRLVTMAAPAFVKTTASEIRPAAIMPRMASAMPGLKAWTWFMVSVSFQAKSETLEPSADGEKHTSAPGKKTRHIGERRAHDTQLGRRF